MKSIVRNHLFAGACAVALVSWAQAASAALIYDESVSGDLLNGGSGASSFTSLGTLATGIDNVKGVVGVTDGTGYYDAQDAVSFTLASSATLDLSWYSPSWTQPVGMLYDSSFNLLDTQATGSQSYGTLSAGDYFFTVSPFDTTTPTSDGSTRFVSYKLSFDVSTAALAPTSEFVAPVPLPATGVLLLGGLGGLAAMRRRRRRG